jgi:GT2 family glycosyltransferase
LKLSIVIICWNDLKVIKDCLSSIYKETTGIEFEIIVSDNASADGSIEYVRENFPDVRVVSNGGNLGFAKGNNAGIRVARGDYVLILNPDTIIHGRALEKLVAFADQRPDGAAFGCRVLNPDGSDQGPAVPLPTLLGSLLAAFCLRWPGRISKALLADEYPGWDGQTEREIGRQSGCCILVRRDLLTRLNGFDERFFYHCEETDLCCRIWKSGWKVLFCPKAEITHIGGQSVGRFPIRFALETYRSRYRYFYKHFGKKGIVRFRMITLLHLGIRRLGYKALSFAKASEALKKRLEMYRVVTEWNSHLDPVRFIECGEVPDVGYEPLAPAPKMIDGIA